MDTRNADDFLAEFVADVRAGRWTDMARWSRGLRVMAQQWGVSRREAAERVGHAAKVAS